MSKFTKVLVWVVVVIVSALVGAFIGAGIGFLSGGNGGFIAQVLIPLIILALVCFYGGRQYERENRKKQLRQSIIRYRELPKKFDWKV